MNNYVSWKVIVFSAHKSEEIQEYAKDLGIVLHFISSGLTDLYQPLDVKLFAIVKAYLKHIVRQFLREDRIITKQLAYQFMVRAWKKLPLYFIQGSFEISHNKGQMERKWTE